MFVQLISNLLTDDKKFLFQIRASATNLEFDNYLKKSLIFKNNCIMILFLSYINAVGPFLKAALCFFILFLFF